MSGCDRAVCFVSCGRGPSAVSIICWERRKAWSTFSPGAARKTPGRHDSVAGNPRRESLSYGSVVGVASLYVMAAIYARLGKRAGGKCDAQPGDPCPRVRRRTDGRVTRHLGVDGVLAGEATFIETAARRSRGLSSSCCYRRSSCLCAATIWSMVLQVMGFSEIQGLLTRKAFGVWVLGQIIGLLAALFLTLLIATLLPNP